MLTRLAALALLLTSLTACPEGTEFFFFSNGQVFNDVLESGNGIIIGVGVDGAQSSTLVSGDLPPGMALQADGTVAGVPEENGLFEFTVETVDAEGQAALRTRIVEIGD